MIACATPDDEEKYEEWEHQKFFDEWNQQFLKRQSEIDNQKESE